MDDEWGGIMSDFLTVFGMILEDAIFSGIAALGFAILFDVPRRALMYCVLAGAVGHAVRTLMMEQFLWSITASTLVGATTVGMVAKYCAHHLKMPSLVFGISGAIPMVPGVFAFQTMLAVIQLPTATENTILTMLTDVAVNASTTGFILAAIALGIAMPNLLFLRHKPVV